MLRIILLVPLPPLLPPGGAVGGGGGKGVGACICVGTMGIIMSVSWAATARAGRVIVARLVACSAPCCHCSCCWAAGAEAEVGGKCLCAQRVAGHQGMRRTQHMCGSHRSYLHICATDQCQWGWWCGWEQEAHFDSNFEHTFAHMHAWPHTCISRMEVGSLTCE